jgi:hypothetical protein
MYRVNPAGAPQNIKTTFSGGFCVFGTLPDLNAPFDPVAG